MFLEPTDTEGDCKGLEHPGYFGMEWAVLDSISHGYQGTTVYDYNVRIYNWWHELCENRD